MNGKRGMGFFLSGLVLAGLLVLPASVFGDVKVRVYVPSPPPPAQVEVIGVAPSSRHVWIAGYHRWDGGAYVWVPGHWVVRPRPRAIWVKGHWSHHPRGWYWVEGRWR
jgi:WXXGXW repeat (2 copies)